MAGGQQILIYSEHAGLAGATFLLVGPKARLWIGREHAVWD